MLVVAALAGLVLGQLGCESDAWLIDPSEQGRWEVDAITLPILKSLESIEEQNTDPPNLTPVMPEDLIAEPSEYVIGPGDVVTISVLDLMEIGREAGMSLRVSDTGVFRHPILGDIGVSGRTAPQLEEEVARIVRQQGMVKDPRVTVLIQEGRQNIFRIISEPWIRNIRPGLYAIIGPDFRLLDAVAMAGGVPPEVPKVYVIRQASLVATQDAPAKLETDPADDPGEVIKGILRNGDAALEPAPEAQRAAPPQSLENSLDEPDADRPWVNVGGRWVRVEERVGPPQARPAAAAGIVAQAEREDRLPEVVQRVIEVPFDLLVKGDLRYNVVVRPGDIIRVPAPIGGSVFLAGHVARPGTYGLPGDQRLTLKRLIAAAGGFDAIAIPQRVDITRKINRDYEATVRLDLSEIYHGNEPDIYLKTDDLVNVGTNMVATPLAVIRSGFRMSYGFGFILDRNFGPEVFGPVPRNNGN